MPKLGYKNFTDLIPFRTNPIFNGIRLRGAPKPLPKTPSHGANIFEMMNGDMIVQLDYQDRGKPETTEYYSWTFRWQAGFEDEWYEFQKMAKLRRAKYFVPFDYEMEAFVIGLEQTDFTLWRPTAKSIYGSSFPNDFLFYTMKAWINDVEQTVVENLTPGTGEVGILGQNVRTPELEPNDELIVAYVPAYRVIVDVIPNTLEEVNMYTGQITLREQRRE